MPRYFSQYRVDEPFCPFLAFPPGEFDGGVHRAVNGYAIQKNDLVCPEPKRRPDTDGQAIRRFAQEYFESGIQAVPPPQYAVDEFPEEGPISGIKIGGGKPGDKLFGVPG